MTVSLSLIHQHFLIYTIIPKTRETGIFKNVFPYFENRLWLPAQVYFEFLKTRDTVAAKPEKTYMALLDKDESGHGVCAEAGIYSYKIRERYKRTKKEY